MINISKILSEEFSIQELINFISDLSRLHRIQGCKELEEAGEYIKSILEKEEALEVELKKFSYNKPYGSFRAVTGWWVKDGELRLIKPKEELIHSYKNSRTLITAHSPGGTIEGEVVHIGDGENPANYEKLDVNGKIVLAYGYPYIIYKQATSRGAIGLLIYKKSGVESAVPYTGLFLTPEEAREAKAPSMSISRRMAEKLIRIIEKGEKPIVKMKVEAGYREEAWIPVVTAKIGNSETEIHLCAHYCHPAGTVNDNISGTATLMELALSFARAIKKGKITKPDKHSIKFIWFPEYAGSLAYMINTKQKVEFCINLDMIGEKQHLTGSTLNFIKSPPRYFHPYEAVVYYKLKQALSHSESLSSPRKALSYKYDVNIYETGSDHDVYLHFNTPSIMLNQWPDKYYHSDQDTIDKFDPQIAAKIAMAVGTAAYIISKNEEKGEVENLVRSYFYEYIGRELSETPSKLLEKRQKYLIKTIGKRILSQIQDEIIEKIVESVSEKEGKREEELYVYKGPIGPISTRQLFTKLSREDLKKLRKIYEKEPYMRTLRNLIPLYMKKPTSLNRLKEMIEEDYGIEIETKIPKEMIEMLIKANLIEKAG
ncbi:MAG: DUF4910 domain-containing protein [archaeon GB-1867-035]|nr:DUF4910 domain-containing protein [Candidatus Culexmicrobium profundum]